MMCSEAVWWRCHRRIVADHPIARDKNVFHLMDGKRAEPALLSEGACVADGRVTYPERPDLHRKSPQSLHTQPD